MNIFCDTNIITEFLEKRLLFDAVAKILTLASTSHTWGCNLNCVKACS